MNQTQQLPFSTSKQEAHAELAVCLRRHNLFEIFEYVLAAKEYRFNRFDRQRPIRADLLLIPNRVLLDHGWQYGAMVVNVPGADPGGTISSLIHARDCVFQHPENNLLIQSSCLVLYCRSGIDNSASDLLRDMHLGELRISDGLPFFIWDDEIQLHVNDAREIEIFQPA